MKWYRPVIASEAKQSQFLGLRLPRRYAPRNDINSHFFISLHALRILLFVGMMSLASLSVAFGSDHKIKYFPSFADKHTVGLWLFDENHYPYSTITDASQHEYDLRLMRGGQLVKGRYGNCLKCTPGLDYNVSYAAIKGSVGFVQMREMSGRPGSGLWGPTTAPEQIARAFGERNFTCEFWLLLMSNPIQDVVLIDLGDKFEAGFTVILKRKAAGFVIANAYAGFKAECPGLLEQIWGRSWHHIAFTYSKGSNSLNYFIDGREQEAVKISKTPKAEIPVYVRPKSIAEIDDENFRKENRDDVPYYKIRKANRFNFSIGQNRQGGRDFNGNIDELRISDTIRYTSSFALPDSFSRNYRKGAPKSSVANGPALLFGPDKEYLPNEPVMLGSRKHVFIDEVMIDRKRNVSLRMNQPTEGVVINELAAWDASFFEHEGKIYTVVSEGYEGDEAPINLLVSEDGINFQRPKLGLIEYKGSNQNNLIMLGVPSWGKYFKDSNPVCPPEELFKATLWVGQRGIYLYFSPDSIHWRRNETCMLPLVSGGGCETFWDDQQGKYFNYIKRDGSYKTGDYPNYGRSTTMFKTTEINKAWPFDPVANPYYEGWPFPAVTGEGITVVGPNLVDSDYGQIFRTRPQKYEWAPDTYVSFMFRNGSDMGISRDALNWKIGSELGLGYYMGPGKTVDGREYRGGDIANGMIRRGDKIWQWANCNMVEGKRSTIRFTQRLDGFLSLDAGRENGIVLTRPFVFDGSKLILNVKARGIVKVGITNLPGISMTGYNIGLSDAPKKPVRGYSVSECDPIRTDSVNHVVTWKSNSNVRSLAGQVVRLRFEMQDAKLFAFKFE